MFEGLPSLSYLTLEANECINKTFENWTDIQLNLMSHLENCTFIEFSLPPTKDLYLTISKEQQKPLVCEKITSDDKHGEKRKKCLMNQVTTISTDNVELAIPEDLNMTVLDFTFNNGILFLPVLVKKSFPNLRFFYANLCSVQEISKKNFENLNDLRYLSLEANFITKIRSDTFEGLSKLDYVSLGEIWLFEYIFLARSHSERL